MKEKDLKINVLMDVYGALLTDKQREALEYYYEEDLSLAEIAEHTGVTRQGVRDNIKRGEQILYDTEMKLGVYEKYGSLESDLNKACELLSGLDDSSGHLLPQDISKACDDVKKILKKYMD